MYRNDCELAMAVLALFACAGLLRGEERLGGNGSSKDDAPKPPVASHPPFTIGKETTFITEPLDKDGYPDYVAALNERYSKGVTPENNGAVLYWSALGPNLLPCFPEQKADYLRRLGIGSLPEKGDYFVLYWNFEQQEKDEASKSRKALDASQKEAIATDWYDQFHRAARRPWSKQEFPRVAALLAANEKALYLIVDASKRPQWFDPLQSEQRKNVFGSTVSPFRFDYTGDMWRCEVQTLSVRAMLNLKEGRVDPAWEDLMAIHRLANLAASGPSFSRYCQALFLERWASRSDVTMLASTRLSPAQIAKMRQDLERLPPVPGVVDKIDIGNRFEYLNLVCWFSRTGWPMLLAPDEAKTIDAAAKRGDIVDWDLILRRGNATVQPAGKMHPKVNARRTRSVRS